MGGTAQTRVRKEMPIPVLYRVTNQLVPEVVLTLNKGWVLVYEPNTKTQL